MKARPSKKLTHLNAAGEAHMVDVTTKAVTARQAKAEARVHMATATAKLIAKGSAAKGDVLATARIAGIQGAKRTPELIPLCHGIALTKVTVDFLLRKNVLVVTATANALDRTGVEMEALVAASTAALTVYDMLKAVDRGMRIEVELSQKSGGRSGSWSR